DVTLNLASAFAEAKKPTRDPQDMPLAELQRTIQQKQAARVGYNSELVELHRRFALPFSSVVFCPLSLPPTPHPPPPPPPHPLPPLSRVRHEFRDYLRVLLAPHGGRNVREKRGSASRTLALVTQHYLRQRRHPALSRGRA